MAQGGRLVDPKHILEFNSIGCAEQYMYGRVDSQRLRAEYCYVVMFLDEEDGFAMLMSSWDACYGMARNHPDAVFMLYSRLWEAEAAVMA